MNQVIKTESPESTGTNAILIVLLLAAVVAFGIWFFGQGALPGATTPTNDAGLNVDVNLPQGGVDGANPGNTGTQQ